jgi:hypothetical protein
MLLKYFSLSKIMIALGVSFIFVKIYQHNLVIKLNYEKQRLEKRKLQQEKVRNDFIVEYLSLTDPAKILTKAKGLWGMKPIKICQVRSVPALSQLDFFGSISDIQVLKKQGLYDVVSGYTGR